MLMVKCECYAVVFKLIYFLLILHYITVINSNVQDCWNSLYMCTKLLISAFSILFAKMLLDIRDAPIIGIGRLVHWYRPIVVYIIFILITKSKQTWEWLPFQVKVGAFCNCFWVRFCFVCTLQSWLIIGQCYIGASLLDMASVLMVFGTIGVHMTCWHLA